MEPQVTICCGKKNTRCNCLSKILYIFIALFIFLIGIIIGALTTIVTTIGAVYFYALATVFGILAIISFVYILCSCKY